MKFFSFWKGKTAKSTQALWNTMNNYANDNGTGLEQQVIMVKQDPERESVRKSVKENFFPTGSAIRWEKSNMAAYIIYTVTHS